MIERVSRRIGCTEGQLQTVGLGLALALALASARPTLPGAALDFPYDAGQPAAAPPAVVVPTAPGAGPTGLGQYLPTPSGTLAGNRPERPVAEVRPDPGGAPPVLPAGPATPGVFARIGAPGSPGGLALGRAGRVYVSTDNGTDRGMPGPSKLFWYDGSGRQLGEAARSDQQPNHSRGLGAVAVDPMTGAVVVVDVDTSRLLTVDATGHWRALFAVPNVPSCVLTATQPPCEPGVVDHAPAPAALAYDASGNLFIADAGQGTIWRWHEGQKAPQQWYQAVDLATGDGPAGLAFDPTGALLFTAGSTLDASSPNAGALYSLAIGSDGAAGARTLIFSSSDRPGAVTSDAQGDAYVILRGKNALVRVVNGAATAFPTTGAGVPLDAPVALAIVGDSLLVANQSATNNPAHWAVLRFPVGL